MAYTSSKSSNVFTLAKPFWEAYYLPLMSIESKEKQLVSEFSSLPDWEAIYKKIIEEGKRLPKLPDEFYADKYKVKGCQSQVWLKAEARNGNIYYQGDSDAMLVKGLLSLLLDVYSGEKSEDIIKTKAEFIKDLKLESHLTPSRSNGLFAMLKQIRIYAQAFYMMGK